MPPNETDAFDKPKWNQAAIWTGSDLFGLLGLLNKNRWRVSLTGWPGCLIDLAFATANTSLRALQAIVCPGAKAQLDESARPLFILGHWRTGTTLLHDLLTLDANHAAPTTFQCFAANHFLLTERILKGWSAFTLPASRPPDQMKLGWDLPQEDEFALCSMGIPSIYHTIAFPNHPAQNLDFLELESVRPRQRERWKKALRRFLGRVQRRSPGRMILKSPSHSFRIPVLLEMFPQARFVHLTRHPVAVYLSTVRLWKSLFLSHAYQKPRFEGLEEFVLETFLRMHERMEATRCHVPEDRLLDLRYEDLVSDIPGTVKQIYEQLELGEFSNVEAPLASYLSDHAGYKARRYQPPDELQDELFRRWRPYYERYGYDDRLAHDGHEDTQVAEHSDP